MTFERGFLPGKGNKKEVRFETRGDTGDAAKKNHGEKTNKSNTENMKYKDYL
jgi:hypothetical protein